MAFESIIGNNKVKNLLTSAISHHSILHSYMFMGEDGIGKFLFAKEFAKSILCNSSTERPCNYCKSCIIFDSNNHPDFLVIDTEDGKSIKIEQIRFLQEKISEKPITSNRKVYIINNSNLMTKEAQNCLLKTLEEPPLYATLILIVADENKLLNTIKSRCTKINFSPLNNNEIAKYLQEHEGEENFKQDVLTACHGSIGKALKLKDEFKLYQNVNQILENISHQDIVDVWNTSDCLYKEKDNINDLLEYMNVILVNHLTENYELKYANCISIIEETKSKLLSNANYDMAIDYLLMNLWEELHEKYSRN